MSLQDSGCYKCNKALSITSSECVTCPAGHKFHKKCIFNHAVRNNQASFGHSEQEVKVKCTMCDCRIYFNATNPQCTMLENKLQREIEDKAYWQRVTGYLENIVISRQITRSYSDRRNNIVNGSRYDGITQNMVHKSVTGIPVI
jgi:tRNA/tmRNA/rRNA uracil-C5-methylase (TrmA/RlmC/RlmD family)